MYNKNKYVWHIYIISEKNVTNDIITFKYNCCLNRIKKNKSYYSHSAELDNMAILHE